jgi:hypothetical protein
MSRRKRRPAAAPAASRPGEARSSDAGAAPAAGAPPSSEPRPAGPSSEPGPSTGPRSSPRRLALDLGILAAVFGATVAIAELVGAANLGVAIGVGQVAFAIALVVLLRE